MRPMNIYLTGVGGQGIGLLAGTLTRACMLAGYRVRGCDTHGLAQRGGTVVSHLRIGDDLFTPRVPSGQADVVIGLERLETLRGAATMLKKSGVVLYYDAMYQPIHVRMGEAKYPSAENLRAVVKKRNGRIERVFLDSLADPRMQNVALLGRIAATGAIEGVTMEVLEQALQETVPARVLEANLEVFREAAASKEN
ncbi:MAG: pyruvate ferredoxin oxidoreductase [Deltaproteobacteria bacterium]|nr:pyruvate ferredoxin oxidoreductase [Deltaproteobacteria bacterium]